MNGIIKKLICLVLLVVIVLLAVVIVRSIQKPIEFNKEKEVRKTVAVQRLKDIRELQVAYKSVNGNYTADFDSLINFYKECNMEVVMQIGSSDDSLAVVNTEALKKKNKKITAEEMFELYKQGQNLVFSIVNEIPVRDTLFNNRPDFDVDSLRYIPYSGRQLVEMDALVKKVSGVNVPLFEAKMPYRALLKGLDNQLRINLDADAEAGGNYPGLMVGSVTSPNNNAGNWE